MLNKKTVASNKNPPLCEKVPSCYQCRGNKNCVLYADFKVKSYSGTPISVTLKENKNYEVVEIEMTNHNWLHLR
jgi:hypothetical protein